jgi:hypothetical protein
MAQVRRSVILSGGSCALAYLRPERAWGMVVNLSRSYGARAVGRESSSESARHGDLTSRHWSQLLEIALSWFSLRSGLLIKFRSVESSDGRISRWSMPFCFSSGGHEIEASPRMISLPVCSDGTLKPA